MPLHGLGGWRASMGADRINTEDMSGTSQSPGGVTLSRSCCRPCRRLPHVLFNEKREFYGEGGGGEIFKYSFYCEMIFFSFTCEISRNLPAGRFSKDEHLLKACFKGCVCIHRNRPSHSNTRLTTVGVVLPTATETKLGLVTYFISCR